MKIPIDDIAMGLNRIGDENQATIFLLFLPFIVALDRCIGGKKLQCVHFFANLRYYLILLRSALHCSKMRQSVQHGHDKNETHRHTHIDYVLDHLDLSLALLLCSTRKLFNANEKKIALFFLCVREKKHKINNMKKENALKTQRTFDLYTLVWSVICCDAAAGYGLCHTAHGIVYILLSQRNSLPCKLSEENQSKEWIWGKTSFDGNLLVSLIPFFLRFLQL